MPEARTLGELVVQEGILDELTAAVADINAHATREAKSVGKHEALKVQCSTCTAKKACCHSIVVARLYEGVVVAGLLKRTDRDRPELRQQLADVATAMEAASPYAWRVPCVFLDGDERCTVYGSRPTPCGTLLVYSPAEHCNDATAVIRAYIAHAETAAAFELEERFRNALSLRKKIGRRYMGVLPRMVLLALEAWDRPDFRELLRLPDWPTDEAAARWGRRDRS